MAFKVLSLCGLLCLLLLNNFTPTCFSLRVPSSPLILPYHNGPLLSGLQPIKLYLTFYGHFSPLQRSSITSFLASLSSPPPSQLASFPSSLLASLPQSLSSPSVSRWWSLTRGFSDLHGRRVSQTVSLMGEASDDYSLGKALTSSDLASLVGRSLHAFPADPIAVYIILTAEDVFVEGFCMHSCGRHAYTAPADTAAGYMLPYLWVGNSKTQCPGFCAWPFAKPEFGPPAEPLKAPNEIGVDGMIITLAKVLVGAVTNPFGNAYFQGDASNALEAGGACTGSFGAGAYPGYPGELLLDSSTGASYNMEGVDGKTFLVPWIWNPATLSCAGQP